MSWPSVGSALLRREMHPAAFTMWCVSNLTQSSGKQYREIIGSVEYLSTYTRSDLAFSHSKLSQYLSDPSVQHMKAAKHVLRYIQCTLDLCTYYTVDPNDPNSLPLGYSDAIFSLPWWNTSAVGNPKFSGWVNPIRRIWFIRSLRPTGDSLLTLGSRKGIWGWGSGRCRVESVPGGWHWLVVDGRFWEYGRMEWPA